MTQRESLSDNNITQLAHFEVRVTVVDHPVPPERRRWNGGPLVSEDADTALHEAVDNFRATLAGLGFEIVRTGYGVHATEVDDAR